MLHSRGGGQGVAKAKGRLGGEGCITEGALKQEVQNGGEQNAVETKENQFKRRCKCLQRKRIVCTILERIREREVQNTEERRRCIIVLQSRSRWRKSAAEEAHSAVFESGIESRLTEKIGERKRQEKEKERECDANPYFYHDVVSVVSV